MNVDSNLNEIPEVDSLNGNRIRVLHILHGLSMGGMENRVVRLVAGLNPQLYQITILTFRKSNRPQITLPEHIEPAFLEIKPGIHFLALFNLIQFIRQGHFDIVHTHNWGSMFYGVIAAKLAGVRVIFQGEHGLEGKAATPWKRLWAQRILSQFISRVVAVNQPIAMHVYSEWRIRKEKIICIPNGVNLTRFFPTEIKSDNPLIFGSIMRFGAVKNIPCMLDGFRLLIEKNGRDSARMILVGSGPELESVKKILEKFGLGNLVNLSGDTQMPELFYHQFSVYLNTSIYEGMSNTILEAMACGIPVIASDVSGNKDLINESVGWLFRSGDASDLASKMELALTDKSQVKIKGLTARKKIEKDFDNQNFIATYHQAYTECLRK